MAQETLVILVYLVSDKSLLPKNLVTHHALELLGVRLMRVMGKIESRHIHAREHELLQHLLAVTCRSNRADNLCLSQNSLL